jgi:hypothetical protein
MPDAGYCTNYTAQYRPFLERIIDQALAQTVPCVARHMVACPGGECGFVNS